VDEVMRAEKLGMAYIVTHPGSHVGAGEDVGLQRVATALDAVTDRTAGVKVKILIESTAGQGSSLGWRFEHLRAILKRVKNPRRLGVCLDTCHIFSAGYALSPAVEYKKTMHELDEVVGLKWVKAFHLNDSKKPLGSRVDRHEHIGKGCIGREAFGLVVNDPRFAMLPMVLETDKANDMDIVNLAVLRELVR
jgi:deoxyribonuclease-4